MQIVIAVLAGLSGLVAGLCLDLRWCTRVDSVKHLLNSKINSTENQLIAKLDRLEQRLADIERRR